MVRLRQIAFATRDLASGEAALTAALGVELCHRDPNLVVFGLENALFPVGDQFLEIVSPLQDGTTAGRLLDKRGDDAGYMVLFQVDDLEPVETRLAEHGIRVVFDAHTDEIRGLHLHPKDVPGAIVSLDAPREPAEWPWAGPHWRDHIATDRVSSISGMTVSVDDPQAVRRIWADALGVAPAGDVIGIQDATVRFRPVGPEGRRGITHIELTTPRTELRGTTHDVLGVTLDLT
jgi:catechol 2,3-dioxygenase-like lactoylglutathione lyase family enzyme